MKGVSFRRFIFFSVAAALAAAGVISLFDHKEPAAYLQLENAQSNPFLIPADSLPLIRDRALLFLEERKRLLAGLTPVVTDSVIEMPYSSSYEKGNRIRIEIHQINDSFQVYCRWWFSRQLMENGGREIALYLQHRINRFDF